MENNSKINSDDEHYQNSLETVFKGQIIVEKGTQKKIRRKTAEHAKVNKNSERL